MKSGQALFTFLLLSLLMTPSVWAQQKPRITSMTVDQLTGAISHQNGYRLKWKLNQLNVRGKSGFGYGERVSVTIYAPGKTTPMTLSSQTVKVDALRRDFFFEGNVTIQTDDGLITTNFLNFDPQRMEIRSFDTYTFKTKNKTYVGRAIHGLPQEKSLTLYNIKNSEHKRSIKISF